MLELQRCNTIRDTAHEDMGHQLGLGLLLPILMKTLELLRGILQGLAPVTTVIWR